MSTSHGPISMPPGTIIGYKRNGAPIYVQAGGSEPLPGGTGTGTAGSPADGTGTVDGQQSSTTQGDTGSTGTGGQSDTGTAPQGHGSGTAGTSPPDDSASRTIAAVRQEFKDERTKRQAAEKRLADVEAQIKAQADATAQRNKALAQALGLATDEPPDPEKLAADLASARQQLTETTAKAQQRERELTVELELSRAAAAHGADPLKLLDSRSFTGKLTKLDPESDSFAADLGDVIKAAIEANPGYKITQATPPGGGEPAQQQGNGQQPTRQQGNGSQTTAPPARSGGEHNGAPGGNRQWTQADVDALPKTRAGNKALDDAIEAGLLVELGVGPSRKSRR